MALDVRSELESVLRVLKNNTTTMAASLTTASSIVTIKAGDARSVPVAVNEYPAILVKLIREDERFEQLGNRNNRHVLEFEIVPLVYESSGPEESDKDILTLTKNIKSVLKSNIRLSGTALFSMPESVDYFATNLDGTYCSASIISFKVDYLST